MKETKYLEITLSPDLIFPFRLALSYAEKIYHVKDYETKKKLIETYTKERHFQVKRETDYGFYRHVKKELMKNDWFIKDLKELTNFFLLDLLYPEHTTLTDSRKIGDKKRASKRTTRRTMREKYPEIIFPAPESRKKQFKKDKRQKPFSTIIGDIPKDPYDTVAFQLMSIAEKAEQTLFEVELKLTRYFVTQLKFTEPADIIGIRVFWEEANKIIRELEEAYGPVQNENAWIVKPFQIGSAVVEIFYNLLESAMALRWFRSKKPKKQEKIMVPKQYYLMYSREEAIQTMEENILWFKHPNLILDYVSRGAYGFQLLSRYDIAEILLDEYMNIVSPDKFERARWHRYYAWNFYLSENPRKYRNELTKAVELFTELDDPYNAGISWAYLSEANMVNGNSSEALNAKRTANELFHDSKLSNNQVCRFARHMADCAHSLGDHEWEKKTVDFVLGPSSTLEDDKTFMYFTQRQMGLLNNDESWKINNEMWKVGRHMDREWEKTNDWYYSPVNTLKVMIEVFEQPKYSL